MPFGGSGFADLYAYWVNIPPVTLTAGTTYWLSIVNNTADDDDDTWVWATSSSFASGDNAHFRNADGQTWALINPGTGQVEMAFNLTEVPEPSSLLLGALAGAAVFLQRKAKR